MERLLASDTWCKHQSVDINREMRCLVDAAHGKFPRCPYHDNADRLGSIFSCLNYEPDAKRELGL